MRVLYVRMIAFWLILFAWAPASFAGGFRINIESIETSAAMVKPGQDFTVSFDATDYEFGASKAKYLIFAVARTAKSIQHFKEYRGGKLITVSRAVIRPLGAIAYYKLLATDRTGIKSDTFHDDGPSHYTLHLKAPLAPGSYTLLYSELPVFVPARDDPRDVLGVLTPADGSMSSLGLATAFAAGGSYQGSVANFTVTLAPIAPSIALYLRANGKQPAFANIRGGLVEKPLEFSWFIGPETKLPAEAFVFRYKIWPIDSDFSASTQDRSVSYRFLPKGNVRFTVEAVYREKGQSTAQETASFNFVLDQHLVANAKPGMALKGSSKSFSDGDLAVAPTVSFQDLYPHSRALIVGIHTFDDHSLAALGADKIQRDVDTLESALKANGFAVTKVIADRLDRKTIMGAVENLVTETKPDDRLIIYFSTHGFPDPALQTAGWLATSDCHMANPSVACIALKDLEYQAQRALSLKAKQVLIAVDSCFSGLGVISKSASPPNFNMLAAHPGAFMLTAGMADQRAAIDPDLKMSTFTYYLAKGLSGDASIFDSNGVITLTQLYAYVQYNVTKKSGSLQTPMLGRLTGDGEMLFKPVLKP